MTWEDLLVEWVLPVDEKSMRTWLALMEIGAVAGSLVFLLSLAASFSTVDIVMMARYGMFALISFLFLSFVTIMQYLVAIEFNTRKEKAKGKRK